MKYVAKYILIIFGGSSLLFIVHAIRSKPTLFNPMEFNATKTSSIDRNTQSVNQNDVPQKPPEILPELLGVNLTVNLEKFKTLYAAKIKECKPDEYTSDSGDSIEIMNCRLNDSTWVDFTNISSPDYLIYRMGKGYPLSDGDDGKTVQFFSAAEAFGQKIHRPPNEEVLINELGFKVKAVNEDFYKGRVQILSAMYGSVDDTGPGSEVPYKEIKLSSVLYLDQNTKNLLDNKIAAKKLEKLKQKDKDFSL